MATATDKRESEASPQFLSFKIPAEMKARLAQACRRRSSRDRSARVSLSSLVRFYIERGLRDEPKGDLILRKKGYQP
jgi:hypothetical protein